MRKLKTITIGIVCFLLLFLIPISAKAYVRIDTQRETSLHLVTDRAGMEFRLYRVGTVSELVEFELTGQYKNYPVVVNGLDTDGWRVAAETLAAFTQRDDLTPIAARKTNEYGEIRIEGLQTGLYLLMGDSYLVGDEKYTPMPVLISLPHLNGDDEWEYDTITTPKYDMEYVTDNEELKYQVIKIWKDRGAEIKRPAYVTIQLMKNGEIAEEVILNEENGWQYVWYDLDTTANWSVVEKQCPKEYTVKIEQAGHAFAVTNTHSSVNRPNGSDDETTTGGGSGSNGGNGANGGGGSRGGRGGRLPQTGQLWWPVPCMVVLGMLCLIVGLLKRRAWLEYEA